MEKQSGRERAVTNTFFVKNTETGEIFDAHGRDYETFEMLILEGIYEHYKSTPDNPKRYMVSKIVENIVTGECFVLYTPLYEGEDTTICARPLSLFTSGVRVGGVELPRFRYIDEREL